MNMWSMACPILMKPMMQRDEAKASSIGLCRCMTSHYERPISRVLTVTVAKPTTSAPTGHIRSSFPRKREPRASDAQSPWTPASAGATRGRSGQIGSCSKSTDPADYQDTPRPIAGMAKEFADGFSTEAHTHPRAQLTWAASGVMTVATEHGSWVVPPHRALWIPGGVVHTIRMSGPVAMRGLYIDPQAAQFLGSTCKVILMSPLLRELVLEIVAAPLDYDEDGRFGHVAALILDEIRTLEAQPLHVPMPRDKRLKTVCAALLREPGRTETLEEWSDIAGASSRTLATVVRRRDRDALCRLAAPGASRRSAGAARARAGCRLGRPEPRLYQCQRFHRNVPQNARDDAARLFCRCRRLTRPTCRKIGHL
jgi:quercetin dioxygenase-like cupin family protein